MIDQELNAKRLDLWELMITACLWAGLHLLILAGSVNGLLSVERVPNALIIATAAPALLYSFGLTRPIARWLTK